MRYTVCITMMGHERGWIDESQIRVAICPEFPGHVRNFGVKIFVRK